MTSPIVTNALINTIKGAGFSIGHTQLYNLITIFCMSESPTLDVVIIPTLL